MTRKKVIAANWKMYKTPDQTRRSSTNSFRWLPVTSATRSSSVRRTSICTLPSAAAKGSNVAVGAQNMYWEKEGAFTGEISPGMLLDIGVHPRDHRPLRAPPVLQ